MIVYSVHIEGMRTYSEANTREHWAVRGKRKKAQRSAVYMTMLDYPEAYIGHPCSVTLTRYASRLLDDDNLASAFKSIRDEVAHRIGLDDAPGSGISWHYEQSKTKRGTYGVGILVEVADDE